MADSYLMILFVLIPAVILVIALVAFLRGPQSQQEATTNDPKRGALQNEMPDTEIPAAGDGSAIDGPATRAGGAEEGAQ